MPTMWLTDTQKIGALFSCTGAIFLTLGILLFFDRALLSMGNILFLLGLTIIIGPARTFTFFSRPAKLKGTCAFAAGIVLILCRWAVVGFVVEAYGLVVLFGDFMGTVLGFMRGVPGLGGVVRGIESLIGKRDGRELPV